MKFFSSNRELIELPEISSDFTRHRLYFDSEYSSQETFTVINKNLIINL